MKKKVLGLLMCVILTVSMLAVGCGADEPAESASSNMHESAESTEAAGEGEAEREFTFTWLHHFQEEGKVAWVNFCIDEYMKEHPNVTINAEMQTTDNFMTTLKTKIATDDAPMIFDLERTLLIEFDKAGHIIDLSDIEEYKDFSQDMLVEGQVDGKQKATIIDANSFNAFYNKDVFEKYSLEVPTTLSEFEHVCDVLLENGVTPIAAGFSELWTIRRYSNIYTDVACVKDNPNWFTEKMDLTSTFSEDQAFKDSISMFMNQKKYWGDDPFGAVNNDALNKVATGEAGMIMNGTWTIDGLMKINPDMRVGCFALPTSEEPTGSIMVMKPGNGFCVYNSSDEELTAVAKDFMRFICSNASAEFYALESKNITARPIEVENIEALNEITAYSGDQVYTMAGVTAFSSEHQDIYLNALQKYAMNDTFDVDALCKELDEAFAALK